MSGSASQNSRVILAVDDSASMRQMVRFTLESAGYRVVQAVDGVEALDYAKNSAVDLVLTDVNMPRMDGITLVRELRGLSTYKFTPMLVLTTESGQDTKQRGKQAGATGWIVKPFSPEQLLSTIARGLGDFPPWISRPCSRHRANRPTTRSWSGSRRGRRNSRSRGCCHYPKHRWNRRCRNPTSPSKRWSNRSPD